MPWSRNEDLPSAVRSALPDAAQTRFRQVANERMGAGDSEQSAIRQAWSVVGRGWEKPKDGGMWVRKYGARHTRSEFAQIQGIHDAAVMLGADCAGHHAGASGEAYGKAEDEDADEEDGDDYEKFEIVCAVEKVDAPLGLVFGWAIVCKEDGEPYFDVQNDHIPENTMLKRAMHFMEHSRVAKEMHRGEQVGSYVFAFPLTGDIADAMGIVTKRTGLMVALKPLPGVLEKFRTGEYTGFSIGGRRLVDEHVD